MKALCGLAFALIITLAVPNGAVGAEIGPETRATQQEKQVNPALYTVIEVPSITNNGSSLEVFSSNVINALSTLKNQKELDALHGALAFVLYSFGQGEQYADDEEFKEFIGWASFHVYGHTLNKQGKNLYVYDILTLFKFFQKNEQQFTKFEENFHFGSKVTPFIAGPGKVEIYSKTIESLLN